MFGQIYFKFLKSRWCNMDTFINADSQNHGQVQFHQYSNRWINIYYYWFILFLGNFKEACVLFSKHMPKFSEIFCKDTNNTRHHIQDEIINICANSVRDLIIEEVEPGPFSIMWDETQ